MGGNKEQGAVQNLGAYEVGNCKPPKHSRFPKGKSGNPKGRPKGSKNLKTLVLEEFNKPITVVEKGKPVKIPRIRAIVRKVTVDALTGGHQDTKLALNLFAKCADAADTSSVVELLAGQTAFDLTAEEYESIAKCKLLDEKAD